MVNIIAFSILLSFSFLSEYFTNPSPVAFYRRKKEAFLITTFLVFCLYLSALIITQRPFFSACLSAICILVIVVVSNTKFKTLREPIVFSDFFLYMQAIKHPRLYLPFLGVVPIVVLLLLVLLVVSFGLYFEAADYLFFSVENFIAVLVLFVSTLVLIVFSRRVVITKNLVADCEQYGVLAALSSYGFQSTKYRKQLESELVSEAPLFDHLKAEDLAKSRDMADIVVVQSESFFDARKLTSNVKRNVLSEYDECLKVCSASGSLQVPAWGANTMRTEFAFLTGLESELLGLSQYYPYQQLVNVEVPSIVSELKSQGYRCVCIHPNDSSFFMRDVFFKNLGFDEFIDIHEFMDAEREGPYVSDLEVAKKVEEVLEKTSQPCFVFAITMENHGPLHLESISSQEWQEYYEQKPKCEHKDLTVYLRHLKNADLMIKRLLESFQSRERDSVFCFYGDHVPAISKVFHAYEYDDPNSNYFIWTSKPSAVKAASMIKVELLAREVLKEAKELSKEKFIKNQIT